MHKFEKLMTVTLAAAAGLVLSAVASFAGGNFEGTWNVKDTAGQAFQITLAADGSAKADRESEGMTGTWKQENSTAVITWNTGWTTKISEKDGTYSKTAFKKGDPLNGNPTNSSSAEKAK